LERLGKKIFVADLYERISQNISGKTKENRIISIVIMGFRAGNEAYDIPSTKHQLHLDICCVVVVDDDDDRKEVEEDEGIIE
jgi:hypothetical protein